ncbi:MAG: general secretion pathway protein GspH [Spirulinaceae cyanobacterium SM2_1_0]|nr:general secretion pathway protein GspH [Spirulinaceae cyanobacterium SM2_1_0]
MTGDSTPELTPSPPSGNNTTKILLIVGGVGCGCLGLPIVLGIIAAIVLPSFLNQANITRQSEARINIDALNRAQQEYFLETGAFADAIEPLDLGIQPETENYRYEITLQSDGNVTTFAIPKLDTLTGFVGGVFAVGSGPDTRMVSGLCEADEPALEPPPPPSLNTASETPVVECAPGTSPLF